MELYENLTYIQKAAIRGEVAFALLTASHDDEIKFRIYLILRQLKKEFKMIFFEAIKEAVDFPEEEIYTIYLETLTDSFPTHLWINEVIADIKLNFQGVVASGAPVPVTKISINREEEKKRIIESAFILFSRKVIMKSAMLAEELLKAVEEEPSLDFLEQACFYLKGCCEEVKVLQQNQIQPPEDLLDCFFSPKEVMSFQLETEALSLLSEISEKGDLISPQFTKKKPRKKYISKKEKDINQEILDIFNKSISFEQKKPKPTYKYIVQKVFKESHLTVSLIECDTMEQAEKFIEAAKKEYPELMATCRFEIKIVNE